MSTLSPPTDPIYWKSILSREDCSLDYDGMNDQELEKLATDLTAFTRQWPIITPFQKIVRIHPWSDFQQSANVHENQVDYNYHEVENDENHVVRMMPYHPILLSRWQIIANKLHNNSILERLSIVNMELHLDVLHLIVFTPTKTHEPRDYLNGADAERGKGNNHNSSSIPHANTKTCANAFSTTATWQANPKFVALELIHTRLQPDHLILLSHFLQENSTLLELNLSGNADLFTSSSSFLPLSRGVEGGRVKRDGRDGVGQGRGREEAVGNDDKKYAKNVYQSFGEAIALHPTLQHLSLKYCFLGSNVLAFHTILQSCGKLLRLDLEGNGIASSSFTSFTAASSAPTMQPATMTMTATIPTTTVTEHASPSDRKFAHQSSHSPAIKTAITSGVTAITKFLGTNPSIQTMNLQQNDFADKDVSLLVQALKKNNTLRSLLLQNNSFTEEGMHKLIQEALFNPASFNSIADCNHDCVIDFGSRFHKRGMSNVEKEMMYVNGSLVTNERTKIKYKLVYALMGCLLHSLPPYSYDRDEGDSGAGSYCCHGLSNYNILDHYLNDFPLEIIPFALELVQMRLPTHSHGQNGDGMDTSSPPMQDPDSLDRLFYVMRSWKMPLLFEKRSGFDPLRCYRTISTCYTHPFQPPYLR